MSWPLSILIALIAGVVAFAGMLLTSAGWVEWYDIPSREGYSGYFMGFFALLGGLLGFLLALFVARRAGPGFGHACLLACGTNAGICAVLALLGYLFGDHRSEPEPDLTAAQAAFEADAKARKRADFDAIPSDAPLSAWFPYTGEGGDPELRALALQTFRAKPDAGAELASLLASEDDPLVIQGLRVLHLAPDLPGLDRKACLEGVGRRIAERIRKVNGTLAEDDPSFEGAANASQLFHAWFATVSTFREPQNGGKPEDFVPELLAILALSRERPEIHTMRQDVCRVASYYAQQWAGVAPLPNDPPPR